MNNPDRSRPCRNSLHPTLRPNRHARGNITRQLAATRVAVWSSDPGASNNITDKRAGKMPTTPSTPTAQLAKITRGREPIERDVLRHRPFAQACRFNLDSCCISRCKAEATFLARQRCRAGDPRESSHLTNCADDVRIEIGFARAPLRMECEQPAASLLDPRSIGPPGTAFVAGQRQARRRVPLCAPAGRAAKPLNLHFSGGFGGKPYAGDAP